MCSYPTVSCVIPTFNRRHLIGDAIESALNQRGDVLLEIIVVDDSSSDQTTDYVTNSFPMVRVRRLPSRSGPGAARNIGAEMARGSILMFLDSDDRWLPNHVSLLFNAIDHDMGVSYGITHCLNRVGGEDFFIPETGLDHDTRESMHEALVAWCHLVPSSVAVKREIFFAAGGFDSVFFGEDWLFFLKLARHTGFSFVPETITQRVLHRDSLCCSVAISSHASRIIKEIHDSLEADNALTTTTSHTINTHFEIIEKEGAAWTTVQDWYMSLKRHGLV